MDNESNDSRKQRGHDSAKQQEAWRVALHRKQSRGNLPKFIGAPNPGASQSHNKAAGRKGGIRRQGSKRG